MRILPFLAAAVSTGAVAETCGTGLRILVARGSNEPAGTGITGLVAKNVTDAVPGSTVEAVVYPATITQYPTSVGLGVSALMALIANTTSTCPDAKLVLMGYSQGAQVTSTVLCGTDQASQAGSFGTTPELSSLYNKNIVAVVLFGDPTFVPGLSWSAGTSQNPGIFARRNTTSCDPFATKLISYCDAGDQICDIKGNSSDIHRTYVPRRGADAAAFIISKARALNNSTAPTTSPTPTPSPTAVRPNAVGRLDAQGTLWILSAAMLLWVVL